MWHRLERSAPPLLALVLLVGLVLVAPGGRAAKAGATAAAASEHPLSTRAAFELLAKGGNAADAMAAAALVAGVVNPSSSGIGGGGLALVLKAGERIPTSLDFREVAPLALDASVLERRPLEHAERGHLVGVPSEVAGLHTLVERFGKRPWAEVVAPAERLARAGFGVGAHLARTLARSSGDLRKDASLDSLYFPNGRPALQGRVLRNPALAATLRRVAAEGPLALHDGPIAAELVATARSAGGTLALEDLKRYRVHERTALHMKWAGHDVFTMPPPSAGGLLLLQTLGLFSPSELQRLGWGSGALQHLLAEAFRAALIDRLRSVGDPDLTRVDVARLLDPARLAKLRANLAIDRTHSLPLLAAQQHGTHHLVVADADGMVVSLTTTVNRVFGAKLVAPVSGVVLNDELDDFTLTSDVKALGLTHNPNAPRPGARPVSSMTPTIVLREGKPVLALGGSGGMAIGTNVTQLLIGRLVFDKSPLELVRTPRFYVFPRGPTMMLEPEGASEPLMADLAYRGEKVGKLPFAFSAVQIVAQGPDGTLQAAADARKFGSAEVR